MEKGNSGGTVARKKSGGNAKKIIVIVAFVAVAALAVFFFLKYNDLRNNSDEAVAERNREEASNVVTDLKAILIVENPDEEATVATVDDPDVLRQNNADFYKNAQAGDYLILYPQRAILYRQSENVIVNIAPIINADDLAEIQGTN